MKKLAIILIALFTINTLVAQSEKGETTISWLTVDTVAGTYGGDSKVEAYMEFTQEDLFDFQGKRIDSIKRVQFCIGKSYNLSLITSLNVILAQGHDFDSRKVVVSQSVPLSEISNLWNDVLLDSAYAVDLSKKLFIGYQLHSTTTGFPMVYTRGENAKQSWFLAGAISGNLVNTGVKSVFLIKANAETSLSPDVEIALNSVDIPYSVMLQDSVDIKGIVKNMGKTPITSFKYKYEVNGVSSSEEVVSGISLAPNATYTIVHPTQYTFASAEVTNIKVTVSEPNGVVDYAKNNEIEHKTLVYSELVARKVLHEAYTSSTCKPCTLGTATLRDVFATDTAKWICVKYHMHQPEPGDPYSTAEARDRGHAEGVASIPYLIVNGTTKLPTQDYKVADFNAAAAVSAAFKTSGTAIVNPSEQSVSFDAKITPVFSANDDLNLRFFAAIVEKRTERNTASNKETYFTYVMKKFLTNPLTGDALANVINNEEISLHYEYTFNGNYRLPAGVGDQINHAVEHSVEDFNRLMVVYWIQDFDNKVVLQAGKADPNPSYNPEIGISQFEAAFELSIYPNPVSNLLYIKTDAVITKVSLFNLLGQTIKEISGNITYESQINVNGLPSGMYLLKVDTEVGTVTRKVQVR